MDPRFSSELEKCLADVPHGRVATCGTIAEALGDVRAAKAVAAWVRDHPNLARGNRVVRADGTPIRPDAARRLAREGVRLRTGRVPKARFVRSLRPRKFLVALREEQLRLAKRVSERDPPSAPRIVGGVDAAYDGEIAYVAAVAFDVEKRVPRQVVEARVPVDFPYIATYLAYRELPAIRTALARLESPPDVLLVDGHGRLHPARFGIACYVGLALGVPTIGVAKHPLVGKPRPFLAQDDTIPIEHGGDILGVAWTPPRASRPLFISVGHGISLETAIQIVKGVTPQAAPEPLWLADRFARKRKEMEKRERGSKR